MFRVLLTIFALSLSCWAAGKPFVRVRWKKDEMRITYKGKTTRYQFNSLNYTGKESYRGLFLYSIEKMTTDDLIEKDGVIYLLADIQGPSRGPQAVSSYCGAGSEMAKVLFVFDKDGEVKEPVLIRYASCLDSIESDMASDSPEDLQTTADKRGKLIAHFDYFLQIEPADKQTIQSTVRAWFDPAHPENGIVTEEECSLQQTPSSSTDQPVPCPTPQA